MRPIHPPLLLATCVAVALIGPACGHDILEPLTDEDSTRPALPGIVPLDDPAPRDPDLDPDPDPCADGSCEQPDTCLALTGYELLYHDAITTGCQGSGWFGEHTINDFIFNPETGVIYTSDYLGSSSIAVDGLNPPLIGKRSRIDYGDDSEITATDAPGCLSPAMAHCMIVTTSSPGFVGPQEATVFHHLLDARLPELNVSQPMVTLINSLQGGSFAVIPEEDRYYIYEIHSHSWVEPGRDTYLFGYELSPFEGESCDLEPEVTSS